MNPGFARKTAPGDAGLASPARRGFLGRSGLLAMAGAAGLAGLRSVDWEEPAAYQAWKQLEKGSLTDPEYIVQCGTLAANAHDTQAWSFRILGSHIVLFADLERSLGRADPRRRLMLMGVGCAVENMVVAAAQLGYAARVDDAAAAQFLAEGGRCAVLELSKTGGAGGHPWFPALFSRRTTRTAFDPLPMARRDFAARLGDPGDLPGIQIGWYETPLERAAIAAVTAQAAQRFVNDEGAYRDSMAWFRRSRSEWERRRDGISIFGGDAPLWVKEWVELLADGDDLVSPAFRHGEVDVVRRLAEATPLWAMVRADEDSPVAWFRAGRLIERIYLAATAAGCAVQPVAYPTESSVGTAELTQALGLGPRSLPLMLLRVGRAAMPSPAPRRDLASVLR